MCHWYGFLLFSFVRVYVDVSLISSAGEGLFAKTAAEVGTVLAFYNGVRITHQEVNWTEKLILPLLKWIVLEVCCCLLPSFSLGNSPNIAVFIMLWVQMPCGWSRFHSHPGKCSARVWKGQLMLSYINVESAKCFNPWDWGWGGQREKNPPPPPPPVDKQK